MSESSDGAAPLWSLDPTVRFSGRAQDYAKHRPDYPEAAVSAILDGLGDPARLRAADIGSGTGIFSRLIADRGVQVVGIEPNAAMRAAAVSHPRVEYCDGSAEKTGLEDESVDLVLSAQSFHWFEPKATLAEFRRILKRGGRLALIWNLHATDDPFTTAYSRLLHQVAGRVTEARDEGVSELLLAHGFHAEKREFPHAQVLSAESLIGRAESTSYAPRAGAPLERLLSGLRELFARHADADGRVRLVYRTVVFLAQ